MIRYESLSLTIGIFRFYEIETTDPFAPYHAVCTIVFANDKRTEVDIKAMCGKITLRDLIKLAAWMYTNGVRKVYADRAGGKRLPMFTTEEDRQVTYPSDWNARFGLPKYSPIGD